MNETDKSARAFGDFLAMEGRSIEKLQRFYQQRAADGSAPPPTRRLNTLKRWAKEFQWQQRLLEIEQQRSRETEAAVALERREVFTKGLAVDYNRVRVLQETAGRIISVLRKMDFEHAHPSRIAVLVTAFRGVLDDIARETGGRQPAQQLRILLSDWARAHAAEYGLNASEAVQEAEKLLHELRVI